MIAKILLIGAALMFFGVVAIVLAGVWIAETRQHREPPASPMSHKILLLVSVAVCAALLGRSGLVGF